MPKIHIVGFAPDQAMDLQLRATEALDDNDKIDDTTINIINESGPPHLDISAETIKEIEAIIYVLRVFHICVDYKWHLSNTDEVPDSDKMQGPPPGA